MKSLQIVYTILFFVCCSDCVTIPNPFKTCDIKSSDFEECFAQAIQEAVVSLKDGDKDLGVLPLDPLEAASLTVPGQGSVSFDQRYTDLKVTGLSEAKISNAKWNKDEKIITFLSLVPEGVLNSHYNINGKLLLLPIQGDGHCTITLYNISIVHTIKYDEKQNKAGDTVFRIVDYSLTMDPTLAHFQLDNLFNGNKQLGDNVVNVMNDNWELIFKDVKKSYEEWFTGLFSNYLKRIFSKVVAKDLLPE